MDRSRDGPDGWPTHTSYCPTFSGVGRCSRTKKRESCVHRLDKRGKRKAMVSRHCQSHVPPDPGFYDSRVRESRAGQPLYGVVVRERSVTAARPGWLAGLKNWIDASNLAPSIRSAADQNRHAAMKNFGFGYRTHT
jgi:hypothetical protein